MLIIAYVKFRAKGQREPRNKVESLCPTQDLEGFEPGTFQFLSQRLKPPPVIRLETIHMHLFLLKTKIIFFNS